MEVNHRVEISLTEVDRAPLMLLLNHAVKDIMDSPGRNEDAINAAKMVKSLLLVVDEDTDRKCGPPEDPRVYPI